MPVSTDPIYRIAGTAVGIGLAVATAWWEVLLAPMRATIGHASYRMPYALILAVAANVGIVWFTRVVTERAGLAVVPAIGWLAVLLAASHRTPEGDLLITGDNWVGVLVILLGTASWAIAGYWVMLSSPRRRAADGDAGRTVGRRPGG